MKRKIYLVGVYVDEAVSDDIFRRYVGRAIKRFHNDTDQQDTFSGGGIHKPERIVVADIDDFDMDTTVEGLTKVYKTIDRLKGVEAQEDVLLRCAKDLERIQRTLIETCRAGFDLHRVSESIKEYVRQKFLERSAKEKLK